MSFFDRQRQISHLLKYNPYHDPKDGKFTSSEGGDAGYQEKFKNFDRQSNLSAADKTVEDASIHKYLKNPSGMLAEYTKQFGDKTANADNARRLFADVGYNGKNSAAVQEASSALNKDVWRKALTNPQPHAVLYAGGSGSGKTSAVKGILPHIEEHAAAVLDGNLSKMSSAMARIHEAQEAGKEAKVVYVYREPVEAWTEGVIKRMRDNKAEMGRVVPMSTFLQNAPGSLDVAKQLKKNGIEVYAVDNSRGRGNAVVMDDASFEKLSYPSQSALRSKLMAATNKMLKEGKITKEEFHALVQ
jgi:hypothetical protein